MSKYREINFLQAEQFHEIFQSKSEFVTLWKLRHFTATVLSQKFRQINVFLKNFAMNFFDGKKLCGSEFFVFPHCVHVTVLRNENFSIIREIFREINQ